ncbi:MAG: aminotransferase class I/II-fold pyridoxal phosphate-dependent enzyme [Acidobacteria bacterium]|nr:aminotransferase class I/II-fold pyridoxal phosphate-dependent enzyme [Acidobacteriota bacterium]
MTKGVLPKSAVSERTGLFTESVIREMTRQAIRHNAVNLAQGFPDFGAPDQIKEAARAAISADINQYAITWGAKSLREAISRKYERFQGLSFDPASEVTVCCGSTESMIASLFAVCNPGDEVVIFEPFYENYGPDTILTQARPRYVTLHPPHDGIGEWTFEEEDLRAAFSPQTRAIILNTPNNPTGKVFTRRELELVRDLCVEFDVLAITDEIYEHILYDGAQHISIATLDGMRERTITISALSKTYSVTGWRVGWAVAPPVLTDAIRKVHDFLTVGAAAPLQEAGVVALDMPDSYYRRLAETYRARRQLLLEALRRAGFRTFAPQGAFYIMTDVSSFGFPSDVSFVEHLVKDVGLAAVPGSSFYRHPEEGSRQVRFAFCKKDSTLEEASRRLLNINSLK